jgi:ATP-dependent DNA helicase DinG
MGLQTLVAEAFASDGILSRADDSYMPRDGQTDMALAVAQAIEDAQALVVEAGTGVGKTFAYLVPALLSGERVLVSTATKTLQDQLFGRDLPRLIEILGLPVRSALLKGRGSYLCMHRMELARQDASVSDRMALHALARVEEWSRVTRSGDLAELPGLDERSPLIPLITSTRENCLGTPCPQFRNCHVNLARREALGADVVVINHHLFFADLAVRESGMAELLPTVRVAIFDEAHQLNETGVQFLGVQLGSAQLMDLCRDTLAAGLQMARGLADWQGAVNRLDHAARELRLVVGRQPPNARLRWAGESPESVDPASWTQALEDLQAAFTPLTSALDSVCEMSPDFVRLHERATELARRAGQFVAPCDAAAVRWLEVGNQLRLVESPLDIAQAVQTRLLAPAAGTAKTWIFTSATLGDDARLSWFTEPCGLTQARILQVSSPFDYPRQAAVLVPPGLVKPADPQHSAQVASLAARSARILGGRTMVLTTTLRALRAIGEALQAQVGETGELTVLVQGAIPKRQLIERFRQGATGSLPGCILVASASFWEGVDIPGDALQLVVIDKLPFPPPNDPLVEARAQRLEQQGRSAFNDYFVPEAAVALKQGAGRLIRRESDQGVLMICDSRLRSMGYGRRLLRALPPMRQLSTEADLWADLERITTVSTTDSSPTSLPW